MTGKDLDRIVAYRKAWPIAVKDVKGRSLVVAIEDDRLQVLCADQAVLDDLRQASESLITRLNAEADRADDIVSIEPVLADRALIVLGRAFAGFQEHVRDL